MLLIQSTQLVIVVCRLRVVARMSLFCYVTRSRTVSVSSLHDHDDDQRVIVVVVVVSIIQYYSLRCIVISHHSLSLSRLFVRLLINF